MMERKLWRNFDYSLLLTVIALSLIGLIAIRSASVNNVTGDPYHFVRRQALFVGIGLGVLFFILTIDYRHYARLTPYLYAVNIGLLVLVMFIGRGTSGVQRWIDLKFFDLQPSELAKLIIIVTLAKILADREGDFEKITDLALPFAFVGLPMALIFLQPDLGTSLVFLAILFSMLFMAGAVARHLAAIVLFGAAAGLPLLWQFLKPYQKMRLIVFVNPEIDPMGYGYQLLQSMIAIGAGGPTGYFFRTGELFQGTQSDLNFLPAQHTDFIYAVLGEEFGFLGCLIVLALFFFLIYRIIRIAMEAKDIFGSLMCVGVAALILFQVLVNVGMTVSVMPVTGLPLPFMSYGGSSFLVNMMAMGVVLNVGLRKKKILF
jgi:rod shape determining protein RodA